MSLEISVIDSAGFVNVRGVYTTKCSSLEFMGRMHFADHAQLRYQVYLDVETVKVARLSMTSTCSLLNVWTFLCG